MAKHKDFCVPLAYKNSLAEASLHQNQGCGSLGKGFKKYGAYHA
jgi:hypothetical protein